MRLTLALLGFFVCFTSCQTEVQLFKVDKAKIGVKYKRTRGTIFNDNYPFVLFFLGDLDSTKRWTPDKKEIAEAEQILKDQIKIANKGKYNQTDGCPTIHRHLNDYFRQYVGITNEKGQKVIHVNFHWDKYSLKDRIVGNNDSRIDFKSDYSIVMDGCSYYWEINVNLNEKTLTNMGVNGVGRLFRREQNIYAGSLLRK